jgi:hypothetical protein
MTQPLQSRFLLMSIVIVVVAIVGYHLLNAPDQRNPVQKMGDAIEQLPNGPDKAARELKDRTPGEKLGDAIKDEKEKINPQR